jgi:hypothetical protein
MNYDSFQQSIYKQYRNKKKKLEKIMQNEQKIK